MLLLFEPDRHVGWYSVMMKCDPAVSSAKKHSLCPCFIWTRKRNKEKVTHVAVMVKLDKPTVSISLQIRKNMHVSKIMQTEILHRFLVMLNKRNSW